jgi:hypothetical protein
MSATLHCSGADAASLLCFVHTLGDDMFGVDVLCAPAGVHELRVHRNAEVCCRVVA